MGEQIDGQGVQAPDGENQNTQQREVFEQDMTLLGGRSVYGHMFAVHAATAFQHVFLGTHGVARVPALVISVCFRISALAYVAAQFKFAQFVERVIVVWHVSCGVGWRES